MDITLYIGNIFLLFLVLLPGTMLESAKKTNNKSSSNRGATRKSLQLCLKTINSIETIEKISSTSAPTSYHKKAMGTILLTTRKTATPTKQKTSATSTESIKLLFAKGNTENDTINDSKLNSHYRRAKKLKRHLKVASDLNHEILKKNMTITTTNTATTLTSTREIEPKNEKSNQEELFKAFIVSATDLSTTNEYGSTQLANNTNTWKNTKRSLSRAKHSSKLQSEIFTNTKYTEVNTQNSLATTKTFTQNPFHYYHTDQQGEEDHILKKQPIIQTTKISNSSANELYINDPGILFKNTGISIRAQNNYRGSYPTASIQTKAINSFNKTRSPTAKTTPTTLTTKQNHMYDNDSALSYLAYKSATLKASSVPALQTLNNNLNVLNRRAVVGSGIGGGNLKRDTLIPSAGIISTALVTVGNNSFMKNSTLHLGEQKPTLFDETFEENVLKTKYNFKSNNSLAHATLAIKQTSQTTSSMPTKQITTILAINETSSASSSLASPSNVLTTESSKTTTTAAAMAESIKEISATTATTRTTSKTTIKSPKRRKKVTTTLKPPPTIDDYQTVTSQAGTHAYLPCNVKQLVKKPISWLRVRDGHILTVDQTTFIADQRFQSIFTTNPERWSLQIKYVQLKDAGIYECQVSTEPKASAIVYLHVVEPKTELIGAPTRHVKAGSQVKLLCIISQALEPPLFINWFYNQKQIYLHNRKGWHTEIERIELPPETTTTTTTTTHIPSTSTTTSSTTTATTSSPSLLSSTSSSMLNGSEISAMHVFTSITPQESLNDSNLLESVSESTYNNYYPNLKQPEAASILTTLKTQTTSTIATTTTTVDAEISSDSMAMPRDVVGGVSSTSTTILSSASTTTATNPLFNDENNNNNSDDDENDDEDDSNDYHTNPTATTFETAEAMAAARGYVMLSSLMTLTDVKQITTASLIIPSVQKQDSGNYTCSPSNSEPRTVILHVLNGEYSASAITSAAALNFHISCNIVLIKLSILIPFSIVLSKVIFNAFHIIRRYSGG